MNRYLPLAAGVALVVIATLVHGSMTLRWSESKDLNDLAERYAQIPLNIGDWKGIDSEKEQDEKVKLMTGAKESISRTYVNYKTNKAVRVYLICGLTKDTAVHTPDRCYTAQGYAMNPHQATRITLGDTKAQGWASTFSRADRDDQRIVWMWNGGDGWKAPENPRLVYRAWTPLNKLYLIAGSSTVDGAELADKAELAEFANVFLPEVNRILYPPAAQAVAEAPAVAQ